MQRRLENTFYILAAVVLTAGLFILSDSGTWEAHDFKKQVKEDFRIAFWQTMGDGPVLENFEIVWSGVYGFYSESADATISLLDQPESDEDIIYVFGTVYNTFAAAFDGPANDPQVAGVSEIAIPENFMQEPPVYNIVPYDTKILEQPIVLGISTVEPVLGYSESEAVNPELPWVTIRDSITGELYCTAIYNGEVSTYLGKCKNDYR